MPIVRNVRRIMKLPCLKKLCLQRRDKTLSLLFRTTFIQITAEQLVNKKMALPPEINRHLTFA